MGDTKTVEVSKIYRQKHEQYWAVVQDLSKGDVRLAFKKLDARQSIRSVDPLKPNNVLVNDSSTGKFSSEPLIKQP